MKFPLKIYGFKASDENYASDVYDELLTQNEIQILIDKVNSKSKLWHIIIITGVVKYHLTTLVMKHILLNIN